MTGQSAFGSSQFCLGQGFVERPVRWGERHPKLLWLQTPPNRAPAQAGALRRNRTLYIHHLQRSGLRRSTRSVVAKPFGLCVDCGQVPLRCIGGVAEQNWQ